MKQWRRGAPGDLADSPSSAVPALLYRPTVDLIGAMETQSEPSELELDDVVITNPHIEAILENEDWIEDASYVLLVTWRVLDRFCFFSIFQHHKFCEFFLPTVDWSLTASLS